MKKPNISAPTGMRINVNLEIVWDWMTETKCHSVHMLWIFICGGSPMADNHYLLKVIVALLIPMASSTWRSIIKTDISSCIYPASSFSGFPFLILDRWPQLKSNIGRFVALLRRRWAADEPAASCWALLDI